VTSPVAYQQIAGASVIPREEFIAERWSYEAGQHVTILGRNGSGKTQLGYELLARTATPEVPAVVLVMKPRDSTATRWGRELGYARTAHYPPPPNPLRRRPAGWNVWPRHTFDPDVDDPMLRSVFRSAIIDSYKRGNRILFADEVVGLQQELNLKRELETVWMRGRSMGCGLWALSQRAANMSYHGYSAPEHMFLAYDPDHETRKRYDEIGGLERGTVQGVTMGLARHRYHFMYIQRSTWTFCVVGP